MIRVRRIDTPKARAAISALEVAKENNRSYNMPEVNAALTEMFRGKCYICENKEGISSFQIVLWLYAAKKAGSDQYQKIIKTKFVKI